MRPLIVFTGQGIARADGFNLTRRAKTLDQLQDLAQNLARIDRQNLDALLEWAIHTNALPPAQLVVSLRALCLKERRAMRKKASHEGVFRALAEAAAERIVVHLTANLDGLTTAFVVRDFGGRWAPFHGACDLGAIHGDVRDILTARRGLLHFPVHGEIGLYVSSRTRDRLITAYHHPLESEEIGPWSSTLIEGSAGGLQEIERRLPCSRLALQLFRSLLVGRAVALDEHEALGPYPTADLLVIGYGAEDRGARAGNPFERTIAELVEQGHGCPSRWRALVYRPESVQRVVRWFEQHRFAVIGYDDGDLPWAVRDLVASARPTERITAVPPPRNWPVTGQR